MREFRCIRVFKVFLMCIIKFLNFYKGDFIHRKLENENYFFSISIWSGFKIDVKLVLRETVMYHILLLL